MSSEPTAPATMVDAQTERAAADAKAPVKKRSQVAMRLGTIGQIFKMTRSSKRWWIMPMMAVLVVLGLVLSGLQAIEYVAPFIYAIF